MTPDHLEVFRPAVILSQSMTVWDDTIAIAICDIDVVLRAAAVSACVHVVLHHNRMTHGGITAGCLSKLPTKFHSCQLSPSGCNYLCNYSFSDECMLQELDTF